MLNFSQISLEKNIRFFVNREKFKKRMLKKRLNKKKDKRGIISE
jgi:hypothetical protein